LIVQQIRPAEDHFFPDSRPIGAAWSITSAEQNACFRKNSRKWKDGRPRPSD
jgi:hypothetical protein